MSASADRIGVGIEVRPEFYETILAHKDRIDFVELISETCFTERGLQRGAKLAREFPVVCHGLGLSIGSAEELDEEYLANLRRVVDALAPCWVSDHLAVCSLGGRDIGHLAPLPFTAEMVDLVCAKLKSFRDRMGISLLLENITYYHEIPGGEMSEADYIRCIVEESGCGLLLDVNNLHVNSRNHGYDRHDFLATIPMDRVVEVHIGGSEHRDGVYVDTHGHPVGHEVWQLLRDVCQSAPVRGIVLERDENIPEMETLLDELGIARSIYEEFCLS